MGARHAVLGGGGGKFSDVTGTIVDYEFTTVHPFAKEGQKRKSEFNPLFGILTARMDGAKEVDIDVMLVGSADDFEVTDDGKTITVLDGRPIWKRSQWGQFVQSLEDLGMATEDDQYSDDAHNYTPLIGQRVRFAQVQQFDRSGKLKQREGKGRDGKKRLYDDTTTVVTASYGVAEPGNLVARTATKSTTVSKPNGQIKKVVDLTETADLALAALVEKFGGSTTKAKLVSAPAQLFLKKTYPDIADELRQMLYQDSFLNGAVERGAIGGYEQSGKGQLITAA